MTRIPRTLDAVCHPDHSALLVYDMQVGICSQLQRANLIIARCVNVISAARAAGMRVVYTRHLSCSRPWMGVTQVRTAMSWQRTNDPQAVKPWFQRGSPGVEIVFELTPAAEDMVFDKLAMSAFEGTPLSYALRDCGITGVVICGIATEIGIAPTVLHATDLGFIPVVIEDACGAGNEVAGARAIEAMRFVGEAVVTDVESFVAATGYA